MLSIQDCLRAEMCHSPQVLFFSRPNEMILECGPMPNVMVALPNIGGALCSTPQSLSDAHYWSAVHVLCVLLYTVCMCRFVTR